MISQNSVKLIMSKWIATFLLAVALAPMAHAVDAFCDDCCDYDAQWFSPVNFDFDCEPIRKSCGYFFRYDKLSWAATGERHTLGAEGLMSDGSFNPYRVFDQDGRLVPVDPTDPTGDMIFIPGTEIAIPPPAFPNGINSAAPRAAFAWGERYEFGHFNGDNGWQIGIIDGPAVTSSQVFGYGFTPQDDTIGGATPDGIGLPSDIPNDPFNQLLSPLGSVLIVFDDPLDLMRGFIDVTDSTFIDGPPTRVLQADTNGDGVLDGDGITDDINKNGQHGPDGFVSDTAFTPDVDFTFAKPDFDDLVILPTSWQTVSIRNVSELQGIEMMLTHRLSNRHHMAKKQNNLVELYYGARFLQLDDRFLVNGSGGVLGESFWDTTITNNIVGPQVVLKWLHQRNRFQYDFNGRMLFGYNIQDFKQTAALGEDLIPGQSNHPLYFSPTVSHHGKQENDFSPLVEMRVQASYQLTSGIALRLGYNATFIDNIRRASQHVKYELPNMGFRDGGTQDIFINGVNFGFEVVH